jgi:beta-lactamase class D
MSAAHATDQQIALEWTDHPGIERLFTQAGVDGTFVSCRQPQGVMTGHGAQRAMQRLAPGSTFKIAHTLIALDTDVVAGPNEEFTWDGAPRTFEFWERDMTLADALSVSNPFVYGEVATRIGGERMRQYLAAFDYGNRKVGDSLIDFWLTGPLEISAIEQCRFMLRLAAGELPADERHLHTLRELLASDAGDGVTLYAKTGWASAPEPGPGWWVGWVEGPFGRAAFALNIDMPDPAMARHRVELGTRALQALGYLP